jgi:hypothetical protein
MVHGDAYGAVLATNLPGSTETLLLRACLLDGEESRRAWDSLSKQDVDVSSLLTHGGHGMRRLAPLLYDSLVRNGLEADPALLTRCRMSKMREGLRAQAFARVAAGVFDALERAGIPFVVLKGAALAEPVYGDPVLRHSHDLELLVPEADVRLAAAALRDAGCEGLEPLRAGGKLRVFHDSGLPVVLRTRLFEPRLYGGDWEWCVGRTVSVIVAGRTVRILSPALSLLHACVHAAYGHGRSSLQWVTDAVMLIRRGTHPTSGLDLNWTEIAASVDRFHCALPLSATLGYLVREMRAQVPEDARAAVRRFADQATALEREVALRCVWWGRPDNFTKAIRARVGWLDRLRLAVRIAVPSRSYAAYRLGGRPTIGMLTAYYVRRTARQSVRLLPAGR